VAKNSYISIVKDALKEGIEKDSMVEYIKERLPDYEEWRIKAKLTATINRINKKGVKVEVREVSKEEVKQEEVGQEKEEISQEKEVEKKEDIQKEI